VGGVEDLEEEVGDADLRQRAEGLGAGVEEVLVAIARVDLDGARLNRARMEPHAAATERP
jgi:hypothetical protein